MKKSLDEWIKVELETPEEEIVVGGTAHKLGIDTEQPDEDKHDLCFRCAPVQVDNMLEIARSLLFVFQLEKARLIQRVMRLIDAEMHPAYLQEIPRMEKLVRDDEAAR